AYSRQQPENCTVLCGTRYGNVMASRGSVIPLFIDQIKAGKAITITDPTMTRYLMSLEEAVELVVYAYQHGVQGDIFVQKSPASTVMDLAKALIEMFEAKTEIKIIGTRHGEKKHETLVNREEMAKAIDLPGYYRIPADTRDLNYGKYFESGEAKVAEAEDYTSENTYRLSISEIKEKLLTLKYVRDELGVE
ncbi:UDP-glucose 4-epimerase, partial [Candidatus Nomurabacteria bacterium]|nr:UDP-glucose 4-epimerase [Candidatus Nomurabacteria bacterium]